VRRPIYKPLNNPIGEELRHGRSRKKSCEGIRRLERKVFNIGSVTAERVRACEATFFGVRGSNSSKVVSIFNPYLEIRPTEQNTYGEQPDSTDSGTGIR
jgi:hypothetical protein